jgi:hypothetical protein
MEIENLQHFSDTLTIFASAMSRETQCRPKLWRLRNKSGIRPCRGAKALGYGMQSPPARAMADYLLKDHKPSAMECKARLRGLWRIIYSKTIISVAARRPKFISVIA